MAKNTKKNIQVEIEKKHTSHKFEIKTSWLPLFFCVAFLVFSYILLVVKNSDYLWSIQDRSIFIDNDEFFKEKMALPGGFIVWIGCYLAQFFYYPTLGATILMVIWLLSFFATMKAFRLKGAWSVLALVPVLALLASTIDIGYWLYYMKISGYWFKESIGYLLTIVMILAFQYAGSTQKSSVAPKWLVCYDKWIRPVIVLCLMIIGYPLLGWWAILGTIIMIILAFKQSPMGENDSQKVVVLEKTITIIVALACIILVPWAEYYNYSEFRIEDAWTIGFPLFQSYTYTSLLLSVPFVAIVGILILLALFPPSSSDKKNASVGELIAAGILMVACGYFVCKANFTDANYHTELRMHKAASEFNWTEVLNEARDVEGEPTREIVLLKNIALLNRGEFGEKFTSYNNGGVPPTVFDSLDVHLVQTCGPLLYLNYGKTNYATRWSIENEVEYGMSVTGVKTLVLASIISNEMDNARKYIDILKSTKFHKQWAAKYEPLINDTTLIYNKNKYPELAFSKSVYDNCGTVLDGDDGYVEMYLLNYFSHTFKKHASKELNETCLAFACICKDIQLFWQNFFIYAQMHKGEEMPRIYQEAAYLYGHLENEVDISGMPFDEDVVVRYNAFQNMTQTLLHQGMDGEQLASAMKTAYGDNFWWFYFFCRDVKSY